MRNQSSAEHAWRHENATQLGNQLRTEFGELSTTELGHVWDVICQSVAVDGHIDRERLGLAVVYARLKAKDSPDN